MKRNAGKVERLQKRDVQTWFKGLELNQFSLSEKESRVDLITVTIAGTK